MIRRQLTLFVDQKDAVEIESVRKRFNPAQQDLIDCHVTLCREDEIGEMNAVLHNLIHLTTPAISIRFGEVTRFDNGKGVMLSALGENEAYHRLRAKVLAGVAAAIRRPEPHITLLHPRNSTCTDEIFAVIQKEIFPTMLIFREICLIEQFNGGKWHIRQKFYLIDN